MPRRGQKSRAARPPDPVAPPPPQLSIRMAIAVAMLLLAAFAIQVIGDMRWNAATVDEPVHLVAGYADVKWGDRRINPEHPPLLKKLAALAILPQHPWPAALEGPEAVDAARAGGAGFDEFRDAFDGFWSDFAGLTLAHDMLFPFRGEVFLRHRVTASKDLPPDVVYAKSDFLNDADRLLFAARMPTLLLAILLGIVVFAWSLELFGSAAAILSLSLFCFAPNLIANSGLVTTDVPVAAFILPSFYFLWRAFRRLTVCDAVATSAAFSLALATKYSALLLVPVMIVLGVLRIVRADPWPAFFRAAPLTARRERAAAVCAMVGFTVVLSWSMVWAMYGFRYSAARDPTLAARRFHALTARSKSFASVPDAGRAPLLARLQQDQAIAMILSRQPDREPAPEAVAAVQRTVELGAVARLVLAVDRLHLLPEAFTYGIETANQGARARPAFMRGEISEVGFRSYFIWTMLLKTPLVTLALVIIAAFILLPDRSARNTSWFLLFPAAFFFVMAVRSGINIGHRHLLPLLPFLFVAAGAAVRLFVRRGRWRWPLVGAAAILIVAQSFVVFSPPWRPAPLWGRHLAYFNELAGGPRDGYRELVDSNLDWGQDVKALAAWLNAQHISSPIALCYFGSADPRFYGIRHRNFFLGYEQERDNGFDGTYPGLLAISATNLSGVRYDLDARRTWAEFLEKSGARPIGRVGYSILLYRMERHPPGF